LLQVGILLHQAKSGRLIIRLSKEVRPGVFLFDDAGRKLGRVAELIGSVKAPYASVAVVSSRLGKQGDPVFLERSPA
jgi:RNA-binding protein